MASKAQWVERLRRLLSGGNITADQKFRNEDVAFSLGAAVSEAISKALLESKSMEGVWQVDSGWLTKFEDVQVAWNEPRCLAKSTLPASVLKLPYDMGVYQIKHKKSADSLVRMDAAYSTVYGGLEASMFTKRTPFWVDNTYVYYGFSKDRMPETVDMLLLVDVFSLDDDTELAIPVGKEALVTNLVMESFGRIRAEDPVNDNLNGNAG